MSDTEKRGGGEGVKIGKCQMKEGEWRLQMKRG